MDYRGLSPALEQAKNLTLGTLRGHESFSLRQSVYGDGSINVNEFWT
jgi:hypothetical protein